MQVYEYKEIFQIFAEHDIPALFADQCAYNPSLFEFDGNKPEHLIIAKYRKNLVKSTVNYCHYAGVQKPDLYDSSNLAIAAVMMYQGYKKNHINDAITTGIAAVREFTDPNFYTELSVDSFEKEWFDEFVNVDEIATIMENVKLPHGDLPEGISEDIKNKILILRDAMQYSMLFMPTNFFEHNVRLFALHSKIMHKIQPEDLLNITTEAYAMNIFPQTEYTQNLINEFTNFKEVSKIFKEADPDRKYQMLEDSETCEVLSDYLF